MIELGVNRSVVLRAGWNFRRMFTNTIINGCNIYGCVLFKWENIYDVFELFLINTH